MKAITTKAAPDPDPDAPLMRRLLTRNKAPVGLECQHRKLAQGNRHRLRFSFWLDMLKEEEERMADEIELLKNRRLFASTIRNGIALMCQLREGRVDLLLELFPGIVAKLAPPPTDDVNLLRGEVAYLRELIVAQQTAGQGAPKPLATLPPPTPDDDDALTVTVDKDAGQRSATNFIKSAFALNGMTYDQ